MRMWRPIACWSNDVQTQSYSSTPIWGVKGRIRKNSIPELIALSDDDTTEHATTLEYELEPAEYPAASVHVEILEDDSRLTYSGVASDNTITLPESSCFTFDRDYKAQLVVNKYHEWDLEMTFDTFDPGNDTRHEMKELYFIKANWVDLEGNTVEYASPLDPEDLEPYDHEPGQPGGEGGAGGPPAGS